MKKVFAVVWKINGAVFVDAGNVWNQRSDDEYMSAEEVKAVLTNCILDGN